ncbi:MAG: hypothetical protein AAFY10_14740, partial [Pseudomonadota bacterium]
ENRPVFFWNLRRFARFMRTRIEARGNGLVGYEITWWGAIRIFELIDPDAPAWDAGLEGCANRIHLATLDVFNPYLSPSVPLSRAAGEGLGVRAAVLEASAILNSTIDALTLGPSPASGRGRRMLPGTFPNLPHLNTS